MKYFTISCSWNISRNIYLQRLRCSPLMSRGRLAMRDMSTHRDAGFPYPDYLLDSLSPSKCSSCFYVDVSDRNNKNVCCKFCPDIRSRKDTPGLSGNDRRYCPH